MPSVGKRSVAKGHQKGREKTVRTGSKVVCVDDRFPPEIIAFYNHLPIKDRHYTIRGVGIGISHQRRAGGSGGLFGGATQPLLKRAAPSRERLCPAQIPRDRTPS
jgi:hypothetical protein